MALKANQGHEAEALVQCHGCPHGKRRSGHRLTEGRPCEDAGRRRLRRPGEWPPGARLPALGPRSSPGDRGPGTALCAHRPGTRMSSARKPGRTEAQTQTAWAPRSGETGPAPCQDGLRRPRAHFSRLRMSQMCVFAKAPGPLASTRAEFHSVAVAGLPGDRASCGCEPTPARCCPQARMASPAWTRGRGCGDAHGR